eukprot:TRINITY_DN35656_c0_g1_i1.p1 TRINITY_DN35656_c0_g1~~TRINITY_DN35656_c0_g1_i1.p1  ORF type:complete len:1044 (-),score=245.24 TRINITY_DN35656_c0_g1_i1:345-3476(-)
MPPDRPAPASAVEIRKKYVKLLQSQLKEVCSTLKREFEATAAELTFAIRSPDDSPERPTCYGGSEEASSSSSSSASSDSDLQSEEKEEEKAKEVATSLTQGEECQEAPVVFKSVEELTAGPTAPLPAAAGAVPVACWMAKLHDASSHSLPTAPAESPPHLVNPAGNARNGGFASVLALPAKDREKERRITLVLENDKHVVPGDSEENKQRIRSKSDVGSDDTLDNEVAKVAKCTSPSSVGGAVATTIQQFAPQPPPNTPNTIKRKLSNGLQHMLQGAGLAVGHRSSDGSTANGPTSMDSVAKPRLSMMELAPQVPGGRRGSWNPAAGVGERGTQRRKSLAKLQEPFAPHEMLLLDDEDDQQADDDAHVDMEDCEQGDDFVTSGIVESDLRFVRALMLTPYSKPRMIWDSLSFLLITYDAVTIPLQAFDPPDVVYEATSWISRFFWALDIFVSFLTGYYREDELLEMRLGAVAMKYLRTWFMLDLVIVLSNWLEVISIFQLVKSVRALKLVRVLRMMRVVRLAMNAQAMSTSFSYRLRSEQLTIVLSVVKMLVVIMFAMHILACLWYLVGTFHDDSGLVTTWIQEYNMEQQSFSWRYAWCFYWAFTQFIAGSEIWPHNFNEQIFALLVVLMGFVTSACVVSSVTTSMTRLQLLTAHHSKQLSLLKRYLGQNSISNRLAARIMRNAQCVIADQRKNIAEGSVELLEFISLPLRVELRYEVNAHILQRHPFFRCYNLKSPAAMRHVCDSAVSRMSLSKGDMLFSVGEEPKEAQMFFILSGDMTYIRGKGMKKDQQTYTVSAGSWVAEAVIWCQDWVYQGLMRAQTDCELMCLNADAFRTIANKFHTRSFYAAKYADEFVRQLNEIRINNVLHGLSDLDNAPGGVDAVLIAAEVFPDLVVIADGDERNGKWDDFEDGNRESILTLRRDSAPGNGHRGSLHSVQSTGRASKTGAAATLGLPNWRVQPRRHSNMSGRASPSGPGSTESLAGQPKIMVNNASAVEKPRASSSMSAAVQVLFSSQSRASSPQPGIMVTAAGAPRRSSKGWT